MGIVIIIFMSYVVIYGVFKGLLFMMGIFLGILGNFEVESFEEEILDLVVIIFSNSLVILLGLKIKIIKI